MCEVGFSLSFIPLNAIVFHYVKMAEAGIVPPEQTHEGYGDGSSEPPPIL